MRARATKYDVAIAGLGAMGSAAAFQLASRGARVIGFDRYAPPHALGSSHGDTRVTRLAIGEGEHLTPLAMRSHELWRDIERRSGMQLLSETGLLIISSDFNAAQTHVPGFFGNTTAAAERFGILHLQLDAAQIRSRWPQFNVRDDEFGYFEPSGGFVRPESCIRAQLKLAEAAGAEFHFDEPVLSFDGGLNYVRIETATETHIADRLILAAGAWLRGLVPEFAGLFRIYRQVQLWFEVTDTAAFGPDRFPVFIWEIQNSARGLYGFPVVDGRGAIKIASEEFVAPTTLGTVKRDVSENEIDSVRELLRKNIGGTTAQCVRATSCLYTVTPDFGFVIDRHPECERVIIASPCSGHGFKHSPAIGEVLADLALGRPPRFDLSPVRLARFFYDTRTI